MNALTLDRPDWRASGWHGTQTLATAIAQAASAYPEAETIFWSQAGTEAVTSAEIHRLALHAAGALRGLGVGPGDVVALQVPNGLQGAIAYQAVMLIGAVVLPIVHIYGPAETAFILRQSRASALLIPDRWGSVDYLERLGRLGDCPDLRHVIVIGEAAPPGAILWRDLLQRPGGEPVDCVDPDDVALLIYTSGTTSDPKGVQHTHNTLLAEIRAGQAQGGPAKVTLSPWPAGHIAGVLSLLRTYLSGSRSVIMDRWNVDAAAMLIERHRVTSTVGAPVMLSEILDAAERGAADLSSLQAYGTGAASVPPALVERAEAAGLRTYRVYGSSEHPTISAGAPEDPLDKRVGTDGRLTPGTRVRILDEADRDVAVGGEGEIVTLGPELFVGYRDAGLNAASFLPGGWYRTGDIGRLDADGYLTITDRKKDIIIRGGENISSKEVEDLLARHPAVIEAAVVAGPHPRLGEMVCAFVMVRDGQALTLDAVSQHFRDAGVARQKAPERLEIVESLPRTASGKVKKFELRERLR